MKNLANCKPSEFLIQTNKIRKSAEKWLADTKVLDIRKSHPDFVKIHDGMTADEKVKALTENQRMANEQIRQNLSRMLDAILGEYPDETLELLALMCFIEPEDVDNHPMSEYLESFTDLINNEAVINFFGSLMRLGQTGTSSSANQ